MVSDNENSKIDSTPINIVLSTTAVAVITVLLKLLGYVEKRTLAYYFGTGDVLDAFLVSLKISLFAYFLFRGIIRPALLPLLISAKNRSSLEARNFGLSVAFVTTALFGLVVTAGIVYAPQLVRVFAEGFPAAKQEYAVQLTRLLLPSLVVMNLAYLLYVSLHTQKQFAIAAWGECLQKVVFIVLIIFVVVPFGFTLIAASFFISAASLVVFYGLTQIRQMRIAGRYQFSGDAMKSLALLAWPIIVGSLVSQIGQVVQTRMASGMAGGSIAALDYSRKIIDLPLILVPMTLSLVVFPYFSEFADKKDVERSRQYLSQSTRVLLILFIPLSVLFFVFREEMVVVLFGGGAFSRDSIALTSKALAGYAPGLIFSAVEMIFMAYFFAHKKMLMAIVCGIIATCIGMGALPFLSRYFSLAGVSGYLTVSRGAKIVLLAYCLKYLGIGIPWQSALRFGAKQVGAVLGTIAVYAVFDAAFLSRIALLQGSQVIGLVVRMFLLALIYLGALYLFRFPEFGRLRAVLRERFAHTTRRVK
jgi:putative peptidoglycan lipid II flippase